MGGPILMLVHHGPSRDGCERMDPSSLLLLVVELLGSCRIHHPLLAPRTGRHFPGMLLVSILFVS